MATTGANIQFRSGTYAQYSALTTKDVDTVYFCEDTKQLFVGELEFTRKDEIENILKELKEKATHQDIQDTIDTNFVELTQEAYDALPDTKLTDGVNYYIKDADAGTGSDSSIIGTSDISDIGDGTLTGAVNQLSDNLSGLTFAQDEKGNWGYIPSGADTVIPFKTSGVGKYYNSIHEEDPVAEAYQTSHAFTTSLSLEAGTYFIVATNSRSYMYSTDTFDVTVTGGTYTILEQYDNVDHYGGSMTRILEVEMTEDGQVDVTGVGQRKMYNTIVAYAASTSENESTSDSAELSYHVYTTSTDANGAKIKIDTLCDNNIICTTNDVIHTQWTPFQDISTYFSLDYGSTEVRCWTITAKRHFTVAGVEYSIGDTISWAYSEEKDFVIEIASSDGDISSNLVVNHYTPETASTVASNPDGNTKKIVFEGGQPHSFDMALGRNSSETTYTLHLHWDTSLDYVQDVYNPTSKKYPITEVGDNYIVFDISNGGTNIANIWNYYFTLTTIAKTDAGGSNVEINHYDSTTASTVVSNSGNLKTIKFAGKPKAMYYALGRNSSELTYVHYGYWDNELSAIKHMYHGTDITPVVEVGDDYIILDYSGAGTGEVAAAWNYYFSLTTISEIGDNVSSSATLKTAELTVTTRGTSLELDFSTVTNEYAKIKAENITLKSAYIVGYAPTTDNSTIDLSITSYDNTTGVAVANLWAGFPGTGVTTFNVTVVATWLDSEDGSESIESKSPITFHYMPAGATNTQHNVFSKNTNTIKCISASGGEVRVFGVTSLNDTGGTLLGVLTTGVEYDISQYDFFRFTHGAGITKPDVTIEF